jgi:UDP-glucuronate decarboxylase
VSNFIVQALKGEPITIFGDGTQTRSFCYVDDLVEGLVRLMNAGDVGGAVNLGNPTELTIGDLARRVVDLVGSKSKIELRPLPQDDPRQRCPDITRARELLKWQPRVGLEEGLKKTIAYFDQLLSRNDETVQHLVRRAVSA